MTKRDALAILMIAVNALVQSVHNQMVILSSDMAEIGADLTGGALTAIGTVPS